MIDTTTFQNRSQEALEYDSTGIIALVDRLLELACEYPLSFDWDTGSLRVRSEIHGVVFREVSLSVFRAIIGGCGVLCASPLPSPYGGDDEITMDEPSPSILYVEFMNTPYEQWLKIGPTV